MGTSLSPRHELLLEFRLECVFTDSACSGEEDGRAVMHVPNRLLPRGLFLTPIATFSATYCQIPLISRHPTPRYPSLNPYL